MNAFWSTLSTYINRIMQFHKDCSCTMRTSKRYSKGCLGIGSHETLEKLQNCYRQQSAAYNDFHKYIHTLGFFRLKLDKSGWLEMMLKALQLHLTFQKFFLLIQNSFPYTRELPNNILTKSFWNSRWSNHTILKFWNSQAWLSFIVCLHFVFLWNIWHFSMKISPLLICK